jgi:hypothetical protein
MEDVKIFEKIAGFNECLFGNVKNERLKNFIQDPNVKRMTSPLISKIEKKTASPCPFIKPPSITNERPKICRIVID